MITCAVRNTIVHEGGSASGTQHFRTPHFRARTPTLSDGCNTTRASLIGVELQMHDCFPTAATRSKWLTPADTAVLLLTSITCTLRSTGVNVQPGLPGFIGHMPSRDVGN